MLAVGSGRERSREVGRVFQKESKRRGEELSGGPGQGWLIGWVAARRRLSGLGV